jgi:hypothetical protein
MTNTQRDSPEHRIAKHGDKSPLSGGRKAPDADRQPESIRSLLAANRTSEVMKLLQEPQTAVQLKELISKCEEDDRDKSKKDKDTRVGWRAANLFTTLCISLKEWKEVEPLVSSTAQAVREGAIRALRDASEDIANDYAEIDRLISKATGNGHSMRAAHDILKVKRK